MLSANSITRQLSDQISLAKAFVVIAKESNNLQFAWELSAQIRNSQVLLSSAATRRAPLTTRESETAIRDMALLLFQAQQLHYDSATMIMRLKAKIQVLDEQMGIVNEKSSKYGQIAAEEIPKGLYCIGIRLTTEWFGNPNLQRKKNERMQIQTKLRDNNLYHFCVFSDNILATSVVVNSTALNSKNPDMVVFHLVVFLDDDVVVQKDLSGLFSVDLNSNVNGAVETCMETFHRYHKYLNYSHPLIREHFDPDACGWAFGMNVFDLVEWRKRNVTEIYHYWQEKNVDRTLWKLGTLPPGLLTFYGLTEPLDPSWHVLGLGYTNVDPHLIEKGAVLHFNGNSKPCSKPQSSPLRTTGVEKLLDMGLDLFKDKKSLSSSSLLSGSGNVENIHQPRRLHVRLMQWPIGLILSKWSMLRISQLPSKSTMSTFSPSAEQTVGLQSQLAEVAAQEKLLIGECLELLQTVSILQVER
ncbi:hypothetical protein D5086_033777 [Populus alba]|uniref:Uncharacterized protein n=1 Tax=Populus alba TaxID=43335 RepID=A0ACC4AHS5_POPAL